MGVGAPETCLRNALRVERSKGQEIAP